MSLGLGILATGRSGDARMAAPVIGLAACGILWGFGEALTSVATTQAHETLGVMVLYTGVCFLPTCWWLITLRWAALHTDLCLSDALWWRVPLGWGVLTWLAMLTNPLHGQFIEAGVGEWNRYGPLWYAMAVPAYGLIVGSTGVAASNRMRPEMTTSRARNRRSRTWIAGSPSSSGAAPASTAAR